MKLRTALLAATTLALPVAVKAQPVNGLYVSLGAGLNIMSSDKLESGSIPAYGVSGSTDTNFNMRNGFVGVGAVGWGFGNGLRAEVEGNYRQNAFHNTDGIGMHGTEEKYGAMGNVYYDFDLNRLFGLQTMVVPYLGAGAGYGWVKMDDVRGYSMAYPGVSAATNGREGAFAYQGIAGLGIPVPGIPGLAVTAEYRFYGVLNRDYNGVGTASANALGPKNPPAAISTPVSGKFTDNFNHSILVGLRYAFNAAPPPPPAPPPAPVPASVTRNYLVFFDWDRADLTDRARQIIAEAASNSKKVQHTRIQVNGYTDTSGTPQYNMKLSLRRAQNVAAELVKDGVAKNEIAIQGFGETHLLVPTGPNVREPQNRRVEIIIQ
jgi:outer membrane protein OmpA-like peptidoglycan-associated protein